MGPLMSQNAFLLAVVPGTFSLPESQCISIPRTGFFDSGSYWQIHMKPFCKDFFFN